MECRIADFHNDIMTAQNKPDLAMLADDTAACVCALFTGQRNFFEVKKLSQRFFSEKKCGQYLSLEDASYLSEECIDEVCGWNPVCISLTWNGENALAGGCLSEGGLTAKGGRVLKALTARGIALDCAHLNVRSFCDALEYEPRIVCTHTCMYALHPHPRNIKDWQVREVLDRAGLIGITLVRPFLGGKGDIECVFRHIDYAVQKFGIEGICFGTDFNGTRALPPGLETYEGMFKLTELLVRGGYKAQEVEKLFFRNLQNYLAENSRF